MRALPCLLSTAFCLSLWPLGCGGNVVLQDSSSGGSGGSGGATASTSTTTPTPTPTEPLCPGADVPIPAKSIVAVPNQNIDSVIVNLSLTFPADCTNSIGFPDDCGDAQVVQLILLPGTTVGTYEFDGSNMLVYGVLETQFGDPGASECGLNASNLTGTLVISALDSTHVAGALCDPKLTGWFDVPTCPVCLPVGADCASDAQCCNEHCNSTSHVCDP